MKAMVFLTLFVAGTVLPLVAFLPWLGANGVDFVLFFENLFQNRVSAFFAIDVIVSAFVVVSAVLYLGESLSGLNRLAILLATFLVGVSSGLPLFFYLREKSRPSPVSQHV